MIYYSVEPDAKDPSVHELALPGEGRWNVKTEGRMIAQQCAADYWHNHDGWERHWPRMIALYGLPTGPEICRFRVEMEHSPEFHAYEED